MTSSLLKEIFVSFIAVYLLRVKRMAQERSVPEEKRLVVPGLSTA
jgi:hypothetical protein